MSAVSFSTPDKTYRHLEALDFSPAGGLLVGASNLNGRFWTGSLSYYRQWTTDTKTQDISPSAVSYVDSGVTDTKTQDISPSAVSYVDSGVTDVKWVRDSQKLIASCDSGALTMWELSPENDAMNLLSQPLAHDDIMTCCSVNCDVTRVLTASLDHSVCVWDLQELNVLSSYTGHNEGVLRAEFHPVFPQVFISCSQDGAVLLWDTRQERPASRVEEQFMFSKATCVAWQPSNEHSIAVATQSGCVLLQDSRRGVGTPNRIQVHSRPVYRLSFAPHRREWLASASNDSTSAVSAFENNFSHIVYADKNSHKDFVQGLVWNPADHNLVTCSWDGTIVTKKIEEPLSDGQSEETVSDGLVVEEQINGCD